MEGCLTLATALSAFNAPINEEQCWALAFETLLCVQTTTTDDNCLLSAEYLFVAKDGQILSQSLTKDKERRKRAHSRNQLLASLGVLLFHALDFGLEEDEERSLSRPLELLIESLTSCDPSVDLETKDEGIERDCDHCFDDVIHKCVSRLSSRESADTHYRAVCRALVAETVELRSFLAQVSKGSQELKTKTRVKSITTDDNCLQELQFHDWARLWIQVIRELRLGVKLNKVSENESQNIPSEYELTPFEMLLDDIRFRRYKLNKVLREERSKKDAHELILDFIRSRPPLVPVSQRQLNPPPTPKTTLYEKLMHSIRERDHKLRPTPQSVETSRTHTSSASSTPAPTRRLIKADLNLRLSNSFDDEDDDPQPSQSQESQKEDKKKFSLKSLSLKLLERRHSITVCESPEELDVNDDRRQHVATIWQSTEWGHALQCLSLTLAEVQHIRSVLTKAELETLAVTRELRSDLESAKICFTCLKTRFSFFGARPHACKVCERAICDRCCTRMHIPVSTFEKVPIYMLSPSPSPPLEHKQWPREPQMLTSARRDQIVVDSGLRKSGPLVRVCRDCKTLLRHLIDMGAAHTHSH